MVYEASRAGQAYGGRINAAQGYPNPEKEVISENAAVGVYYFKKGQDFVKYHEKIKAALRLQSIYFD